MDEIRIAIDIGMSNIDLVVETRYEDQKKTRIEMHMVENQYQRAEDQVRGALAMVSDVLPAGQPGSTDFVLDYKMVSIGVTGGHYRNLPDILDGYRLIKVDEMVALGLGGLVSAQKQAGLVVSAGTGTAMVSAAGEVVRHVTGSAVGGGTLLGLSNLILGTVDVCEIDQLAMAGDAAQVDIMLTEAVGGEVGRLPANANAVNLGKLVGARAFRREDLAAGLVRLVAQVIAVIAINAADASKMESIILIGHTMDLKSVQREIKLVGDFYQRDFIMPPDPGFATARGVLAAMEKGSE